MTTPTFTEGQRVYHRQRSEHGTYVQQDWVATESIVNFNEDDAWCRVTTAQLVAADEVEEDG